MEPRLVVVKQPPKDSEGGFGVGRLSFLTYIVLAENDQDACDLVDETIRDGSKVERCLGVAPAIAASKYDLEPNVRVPFLESPYYT